MRDDSDVEANKYYNKISNPHIPMRDDSDVEANTAEEDEHHNQTIDHEALRRLLRALPVRHFLGSFFLFFVFSFSIVQWFLFFSLFSLF
jgi:hypothetical protein